MSLLKILAYTLTIAAVTANGGWQVSKLYNFFTTDLMVRPKKYYFSHRKVFSTGSLTLPFEPSTKSPCPDRNKDTEVHKRDNDDIFILAKLVGYLIYPSLV